MNTEALEHALSHNKAVILYFYNDACAPCLILRPKVSELVSNEFPRMELMLVNTVDYPKEASHWSVFSSPTLVVFFDGKEVYRASKYISMDELRQKISRYYSMVFDND